MDLGIVLGDPDGDGHGDLSPRGLEEALPDGPPQPLRREDGAGQSLFETSGGEVSVTISVGVAEYDPKIHRTPPELIAAADARLYEAKRGGRNRVCPQP